MAYISQSDILGKIPMATLTEGLDDDADGTADPGKLDSMIATASLEVDSKLSGRHATPFTGTIPPKVVYATLILFLEALYAGRGWASDGGKNPWSQEAKRIRTELDEIGMGTRPLSPAADKAAKNTVGVVGESALTITTNPGRLDA